MVKSLMSANCRYVSSLNPKALWHGSLRRGLRRSVSGHGAVKELNIKTFSILKYGCLKTAVRYKAAWRPLLYLILPQQPENNSRFRKLIINKPPAWEYKGADGQWNCLQPAPLEINLLKKFQCPAWFPTQPQCGITVYNNGCSVAACINPASLIDFSGILSWT